MKKKGSCVSTFSPTEEGVGSPLMHNAQPLQNTHPISSQDLQCYKAACKRKGRITSPKAARERRQRELWIELPELESSQENAELRNSKVLTLHKGSRQI